MIRSRRFAPLSKLNVSHFWEHILTRIMKELQSVHGRLPELRTPEQELWCEHWGQQHDFKALVGISVPEHLIWHANLCCSISGCDGTNAPGWQVVMWSSILRWSAGKTDMIQRTSGLHNQELLLMERLSTTWHRGPRALNLKYQWHEVVKRNCCSSFVLHNAPHPSLNLLNLYPSPHSVQHGQNGVPRTKSNTCQYTW